MDLLKLCGVATLPVNRFVMSDNRRKSDCYGQ